MGVGKGEETYLTTCGAMTLHGPHQVAKQSRTTTSCLRASVKAALLHLNISNCLSFSLYVRLDILFDIVDTHFDSCVVEDSWKGFSCAGNVADGESTLNES